MQTFDRRISDRPFLSENLASAALVAGIIFLAALLGILARPVGLWSSFWPANAILCGLFIRFPRFATPLAWLGAFVGYMAADLLTGGSLLATSLYTTANLAFAATAYLILSIPSAKHRRLASSRSVIYLVAACAAGAAVGAMIGGLAGFILFAEPFLQGMGTWFSGELTNSVAVLPVMLSLPSRIRYHSILDVIRSMGQRRRPTWLPAALLLGSMAIALFSGGVGAFAYPVPALLWCALSYRIFTVSLVTLLFAGWQSCWLGIHQTALLAVDQDVEMSVRLAISLIGLSPITVAAINTSRNELLSALRRAADYDHLTDVLSRAAFMRTAARHVANEMSRNADFAVVMLDIDHFKSFNDNFGHATGDLVLKEFAACVKAELKEDAIFGRLGGEEFALVLPGTSHRQIIANAEAICRTVAERRMQAPDGTTLSITVSVGLAFPKAGNPQSLEAMLVQADEALYRAKAAGRNRVIARAA